MPYSVVPNEKGRFTVVSPKGKTWKTTYPTEAAALKAIDYIQGRFGGSPTASAKPTAPTHSAGQERGEKTLAHLKRIQEAF